MKISELELDAVREVMNIGAGHASTVMAKILDKEIDIGIPAVELCYLEAVPAKLGDPEMKALGVYSLIDGGLKGRYLTIFSEDNALKLESIFSQNQNVKELDAQAMIRLKYLADMLAENYLSAISEFFMTEINKSSSEAALDMMGSILQHVLVDMGLFSDSVLFSTTDIYSQSEKINCLQILFLESSSLTMFMDGLGVDL